MRLWVCAGSCEGQPLSAEEGAGTGGGGTCDWGRPSAAAQFCCNKAGQDGVEEVGSSRPRWTLALRRPI